MVSRLDIRIPNGLIIGVEGDPNRSWRQGPEPEHVMMAKLRQAIATTDWSAVVALYGKAPPQVAPAPAKVAQAAEAPLELTDKAPPKPRQVKAPSPQPSTPSTTQALLGGLVGGSPQPA